jgi:hypothetical protein
MLVAIALPNRIARVVWALMAKGGVYKSPAAAAQQRGRLEPSVDVVTQDYLQTVKKTGSGKSAQRMAPWARVSVMDPICRLP